MSDTRIADIKGRRVWDSRGRPTVEVDVTLKSGAFGRAIAPAGASMGSGEAVDLRDGGVKLGGYDVGRAVSAVNGEIAAALAGKDAADQASIDQAMIALDGTANKGRLGGNAIVATSMAVLHAAAAASGIPLWQHLAQGRKVRIPLPDPAAARALKERRRAGQAEAMEVLPTAKYTVCLSSQVGCALACDFCATGRMGFLRNLQTWEILDQVRLIRAEADRRLSGVVFMGMGEPLLNPTEVLRAARVLSHPAGYAISGRAITLSTAGWVPAIDRYVREGHPYRLAFSVTSAIPEKRARLMPVERTHPLPELVRAIADYARARRERAMVAYVCIRGLNMGREDAEALRDAFAGVPIKVDLIEVTDPTGRYQPPDARELAEFRDQLQILGAPVVRRYSGGKDIGAACGTLEASSYGGTLIPPPARFPRAAQTG